MMWGWACAARNKRSSVSSELTFWPGHIETESLKHKYCSLVYAYTASYKGGTQDQSCRTASSFPVVFTTRKLEQTCRSSGSARLSVTERLIAADGGAGRPRWCQKVTQWNDASNTWLKHHMTHVCAEAHFPHNLLKLHRYIPPLLKFRNADFIIFFMCLFCQEKACPSWRPAQTDWQFHWTQR